MTLKNPLLILALCSAAAPALAEDAEAEPDRLALSPIGSLLTRYEIRRNYGPHLSSGFDAVRYRTRIGFETNRASIADGLTLRLRSAAQASGQWETGGDTLEDPALGLHEGFVELGAGAARIEVGRFEMGYGDQLVIGNVDWNPTGRAFDGIRVRHQRNAESVAIDVFATYLEEGAGTDPDLGDDFGEGDTVFSGVYAGLAPALPRPMQLDVYLLSRAIPGASSPALDRPATADATLGVRNTHRAGAIDYRAEAGVQIGGRVAAAGDDVVSARAHQVDIEVGAYMADDRARVAIEGFRASGDDPSTGRDEGWSQLYPTAHKWLGLMDVVPARTNVQGGVVHASAKPTRRSTVGVDLHAFLFDRVPAESERYRGTEVDVMSGWNIGRGVSLRGMFGVFLPPDGETPLYATELELRVTLPLPE